MKRFLSLLTVCILTGGLIAGCGGGGNTKDPATNGNGGTDSPEPPKTAGAAKLGRYTETRVPLDADMGHPRESFMKDGQLVFYTQNYVYDEAGESSDYRRNTYDGEEVVYAESKPLNDLYAEGNVDYLAGISESESGAITVLYQDKEGRYAVARGEAGDRLEAISIEGLNTGSSSGSYYDGESLYPTGIISLDDSFLVQYMDQVRHYDLQGKEIRRYLSDYSRSGSAVYGDKLALFTDMRESVQVYDLTTGKLEYTAPIDMSKAANAPGSVSMDSYSYFLGMDGRGLFIGMPQGIFRWTDGKWNMIADGGLTSLIMPDKTINMLVSDDNGEFYGFLGESTDITRFYYDENVPVPDKTLEVFSLYDNATLRKAIGEFQAKNPTVKVDLRVAMGGDSSATPEDVIRALNTEILAGKGPDLIALDGLPVESYIEKGVLLDITDLTRNYMSKHGLMENFTNAYKKDGKVFGLPTRFTLPNIVGVKEHVDKIDSLSTFASMVEELQGGEVQFLFPPDELYFPGGIMMNYYGVCESDWFNDRVIDTDALAEYFENILRINDALKKYTPESSYAGSMMVSMGSGGAEMISMGLPAVAEGTALVNADTMTGTMGLYSLGAYFQEKDNMVLSSMFKSNKYLPVAGIGIAAAGKQLDLAKDFLDLLMSREIQDIYLYDGFPVNGQSMDAMIEEITEVMNRSAQTRGEEADASTSKEDRFMGFNGIYNNLSKAIITDSVIEAAVEARVAGLLDGTITPKQAAEQVVNDTKLYLAE